MMSKIISIFLLFAMVHGTITVSIARNEVSTISMVMGEEEENSKKENNTFGGEKLDEFINIAAKNQLKLSISNSDYVKENCYFILHRKESGEKPLPDYPPEV